MSLQFTARHSSLSIMGDQLDESMEEFSKEELNVWNVEKLRKYLKDRGIVITGAVILASAT